MTRPHIMHREYNTQRIGQIQEREIYKTFCTGQAIYKTLCIKLGNISENIQIIRTELGHIEKLYMQGILSMQEKVKFRVHWTKGRYRQLKGSGYVLSIRIKTQRGILGHIGTLQDGIRMYRSCKHNI